MVGENNRTETAVETLQAGDFKAFGELMNASHDSLRDDFNVSCAELDELGEEKSIFKFIFVQKTACWSKKSHTRDF